MTAWQTGQLIPDFGGHTTAVDWRPWGIAHLASTLQDFPLMAGMGLLTSMLVLPGALLMMRHLGSATAAEATESEEAGAHSIWSVWLPVVFAVALGILLVEPLRWVLHAGASSVSYPDLTDLRFWAKNAKWSNYEAILNPPFGDASLVWPIVITIARALGEVAIARWAAQSLARWSGYARGIPAFLVLVAALIGPIGASAGIAYVATLQQLSIWPWPPSSTTLPWLIVAYLALQGAWPERMKASPVDAIRPIEEPLLLPPSPDEAVLWPTVAVTKVLVTVDPLFPKRIAWLVGWHLPLVVASIGLAYLLLPKFKRAATITVNE
jgi:hypothetical protein